MNYEKVFVETNPCHLSDILNIIYMILVYDNIYIFIIHLMEILSSDWLTD